MDIDAQTGKVVKVEADNEEEIGEEKVMKKKSQNQAEKAKVIRNVPKTPINHLRKWMLKQVRL